MLYYYYYYFKIVLQANLQRLCQLRDNISICLVGFFSFLPTADAV